MISKILSPISGIVGGVASGKSRNLFVNGVMLWFIFVLQIIDIVKGIFAPFVRFIVSPRVPEVLRTPSNRFDELANTGYTFQPNYVEFDNGGGVKYPRMHYVDEGNNMDDENQGVILCLHGEPTWSYLYRKMVPILVSAGYRVIVPDFIGFGKSDKYSSMENYTHEMHMATIRMLLDHLNLHDVTLVVHDWGGLIGLSVVKDMPDRFSSLVILNTALPIGDVNDDLGNPRTKADVTVAIQKSIPFVLWRSVAQVLGPYMPVSLYFRWIYRLPSEVVKGYMAPFPGAKYVAGAAKWPLLVPVFKDDAVAPHMVAARNCLKLWNKPALIMFSDCDPITAGQDKLFINLIPKATVKPILEASHFTPETNGVELAENIVRFKDGKDL